MTDELALLEVQQDIHELIAQQAPLETTLDAIANWIGIQLPGAVVAFMRFDPARSSLSLMPSQRFSRAYWERLQNVPVDTSTASFGAAAYLRRQVITEDIQADPRWVAFRDAALAEGFRSCWSSPVITTQGELLGTFGTYYPEARAPSELSKRRLIQAAALIALAVIRDRDSRHHRTLAEWHRSLFVNHPDGVYEFDLEGRFQRGNAALERITGYPAGALIGRHFNEFVAPDYRELTQTAFDAAKAGASRHYETMGVHADGHTYYVEVTNFPVTVEDDIIGVYGICHDITARKRQEAELRLLQRGIQSSPNGILMADATRHDLPLVYANEAFYRITGYTPDDVLGRNCRFLQGNETDPAAIGKIRQSVVDRTEVQVTLLNYRKDGTPFWNRLAINPVFDEAGRCTHFIGILEDITEQKNQEAQIAHQATHDLLTDLPNRPALENRLEHVFRVSRENQKLLAVMHLDLDGFKAINDGLGYTVGNQLLMAVADRLRQLLRHTDTLARLTGDEFVFLMPGFRAREEVMDAAERILNALEHPFEIDGRALHISTSIGIACSDEDVHQAQELLQHADLAVEAAKKQGRNTWQWYQGEGVGHTSEHVMLRHDLHTALRENQFELYYQPVVDAVSGQIRSVEALVRWHHPTHGMVSPGIFIPIAEQTGQIIPLGRWVLRQACQSLAGQLAKGERIFPVAINISSLQFHRDGFLDEIQDILDETGLPPELLELEMTESILMVGAELAIEMIRRLRGMRITVAIDDFGTGFSSLSYLRDLPIHKIKLDRAFIQNILTSRSNAAIVQGIITMAHHMDLVVVAEGVEEREQQQDLIRRNCNLLQGFLFARPMPLADLMALPDRLPADE
ncbi:EAL domain-containing protein [Halomonas daqingensis]|uniref:cyclic-guanylate-specific phosphodiesterase n=2 Tax=Billgrantia desiderata TaxID=52021 RepID=A0AAW4YX23_9GAMM|nr:EAL domain-containing protein [Halomonas desiderata]MCE8053317.1 EAL domain-containing protein [Halomonas desiderata]SEF71116.1 PAS domain S-box-containing protein/diguanylate cyclase (GGDEF) domain-containing protein [Halomonas desiderata]